MTREKFLRIAKRKGVVRWYPSKKVERLRMRGSDGQLFAGSYSLSRGEFVEHPLRGLYEIYDCEEIRPDELIQVGDMLRA